MSERSPGNPAPAARASVFAATLGTRINPAILVLGGGVVGLLVLRPGA